MRKLRGGRGGRGETVGVGETLLEGGGREEEGGGEEKGGGGEEEGGGREEEGVGEGDMEEGLGGWCHPPKASGARMRREKNFMMLCGSW